MPSSSVGVIWELLAKDNASPTFTKVAAAAERTAVATEKASKGVESMQSRMATAGAKLTKTFTLPIAGIGVAAVKMASDYQKHLTAVAVATDQSQKQMAAASKGLMSISTSTGTSLGQLTTALYTVEKGGLRGSKALDAVRAAAEGAKAENADLGTVTNALTSVMASYGAKLGNPVSAMNAIIRGAGLAKTNLSDFGASLSNVVPIAASLGIGFDQIAGGIDTMTQHGETAQRATDNLANLIENLAGQNSVASRSLQQLGVNTIDLSANLGKRGLVGSLNDVLDAVAKNSKNGLVVTTAFKQAATATQSLRTEIDAMTGPLKSNAQAFLAGTESYKDFYAFTKSLGGQQFALAKGFIQTEQTAQGFNDQLKSGNTTTRTTAATLQKALGGVTAMRTALMLSGASAKTFADDTQSVRDAADQANGKILGWSQVQGTLAFKFSQAEAALQVFMVKAGDDLLPVLTKLTSAGVGVFNAFDHLSSTEKTVGAWSLGILAASGPVLSLGSKFIGLGQTMGNTAASIGANLSMMGGTTFTTAARVSDAMRGMTAAIGGAAVGTAIGSLTQNASTGVQAIGALASAATGAAIGFGAAGPWGAAIGGGIGLLSNLATQFFGAGNAAKAAVKPTNDYTTALMNNSKAAQTDLKQLVAGDLQKSGAFTAGAKLGFDPSTIENAVLGNKNDRSQISAVLNNPLNSLLNDTYGLSAKQVKANNQRAAALKTLGDAVGYVTDKIKVNKTAAEQENAALSAGTKQQNAYTAALKSITTAQATAASSLSKLTTQAAVHGTSLTGSSADAQSNVALMDQILTKYQAISKQQVLAGVSAQTVNATYDQGTASLLAQAKAAGYNTTAVQGLIKQYDLTPKQMVTYFLANTSKASAGVSSLQNMINAIQQNKIPGLSADSTQGRDVITSLQEMIDNLTGKTVPVGANTSAAMQNLAIFQAALAALHDKTVTVSVHQAAYNDTSGAGATTYEGINPAKPHKARGGLIVGRGTGTSDSIPAMLSNGEYVINARQTSRHRRLLDRINSGLAGFASGGYVDPNAVYRVGSGFGFQGQYFGGKTGQKDAGSARADFLHSQASAAIYATMNPADTKTALTGLGQLAHSASSSLSDFTTALASLRSAASAMGVSTRQWNAMVGRTAGLLSRTVSRRDSVTARLGSAPTAPTAYDALASAQQAFTDSQSSTAAAVGAFDYTAAPAQTYSDVPVSSSASGILASLTAQASKATAYAALLKQLVGEGMPQTLVQQLAAAGPAAFDQAQALAASTPAQVAQFKAQAGQLAGAGTAAGSTVSNAYYLSGVQSAQGVVNGLLSQQSQLNAAIARIGDGMIATLKKKLKIHSPSQVMHELGVNTVLGFAHGVVDSYPHIEKAASGMSGHAINATTSGSSVGGAAAEKHVHYHTLDLGAAMMAEHRREQMYGP